MACCGHGGAGRSQMTGPFGGWDVVASNLRAQADQPSQLLRDGQRAALFALADRLPHNGVLIADEVGMGKTRIAACLTNAVVSAGGRVAVLIPPGLGFQWQREFRAVGQGNVPSILRSYWAYREIWRKKSSEKALFREPVLLASHAFLNWRLGINSAQWRWEQLRAMRAIWKNLRPAKDEDPWIARAARDICAYLKVQASAPGEEQIARIAEALFGHSPGNDYGDPTQYEVTGPMRGHLEQAICLGLGQFDLVIIDEAHKGRATESKLSVLIDRLWRAENARRVGLTATPVELDSNQWLQTLCRIGVSGEEYAALNGKIECYQQSVSALRSCWRTNAGARDTYVEAAHDFQSGLSQYVLRRDKRSDPMVQTFASRTGESHDAYRWLHEINIDVMRLPIEWRQAVCAAEALSFTASGTDDLTTKRLRLTIGNGHGIASQLDQVMHYDEDDSKQDEADEEIATHLAGIAPLQSLDGMPKRQQRTKWWYEKLQRVSNAEQNGGIFNHPAILSAVKTIEEEVSKGEKVLVFGRYTRPMRALVALLNARAMLRALETGTPWPQAKLPDGDDDDARLALRAAWHQFGNVEALNEGEVDRRLGEQFKHYENIHRRLRAHLFERISEGLAANEGRERALLDKAREDGSDAIVVASLVRAISEMMEGENADDCIACAKAFRDLVAAVQASEDPDQETSKEQDADDKGAIAPPQIESLWLQLKTRLSEEYGTTRGGHARLMYGGTKHETRRLLQAAFNRPQSNPKVLVAQSVVGREGLNLHEACRIVVLLHPEWNPGVVEQQIGRVDRMGSRWEREMETFNGAPSEAPRIEIRPIVFSGTYDEHNWQVLQKRWDSLRAQLHGIVVPTRERATATDAEHEIIRALDESAPNFSPEKEALS
ncbi:MAG: hypothetical protein B7Y12_04120 [Rhizobiales bacterium 24-66-13]|nr:MAG: hypothetical protein B7Y61_02875 [Rhizobiales bacterium 35-66-30]OYZ82283.1 MAG: hypothetical protein B7Y12_04120 [Rhizobiales bacterium 24-66-13]OZB11082.1 MAG: hypothetical protein B7X67_05350 [Rhizobiales bacterium 39-66-18]